MVWTDVCRRNPPQAGGENAVLAAFAGHLDEVFEKFKSVTHYLLRVVEYEGEFPESYVTKRLDCMAALKFLGEINVTSWSAMVIVTDKLRSYGNRLNDICMLDGPKTGRCLNSRADNFQQPFRRKERALLRSGRMLSLQKFAAVHVTIQDHFNQERGH